MQSEQYFRQLLHRYLAGTCTPNEKAVIEKWFEQGGDEARPGIALSADDKQRMLVNIHCQKRDDAPIPIKINVETRPRAITLLSGWRAAAVWTGLILALGGGVWMALQQNRNQTMASANVGYKTITTGKGQVRQVVLPDSSVIVLNANTVLSYHPDFATNRQLKLQGEAMFTVTHDAGHPFTVQTEDSLITTVLGTQFNINSYEGQAYTQVTVVRGQVRVNDNAATIGLLTKTQALRYNKHAATATLLQGINTSDLTSWIKGVWEYDNMLVADLVLLLKNQYGIILTAHNKKLQTGVNMNFSRRQTAETIVETFCSFAGCSYRIVNPSQYEIY